MSDETLFEFSQEGDVVWASYSGGSIRRGFLVGRLARGALEFRYVQLNHDWQTSSGRSSDEIEVLPDGRIRLHESWQWESKDGSGASVLEEVEDNPPSGRPSS